MNNQTINNNNDGHINSITRYVNIHINLFYLIFGNIGNIFKIAFFLQKPLRSLPCTVYILFATISDFVTLNNLPIHQLFVYLFPKYHWIKITVDWSIYRNEPILLTDSISRYDIITCKIRTYLHMLSTDISSQMLVFASINRYCFSYIRKKRPNNNFHLNKIFCHFPNVHRLCLISFILCALISIHHIINFTVRSPSEGCVPHYNILWTVWILFIHCFLLPISMMIFGILTLKNLHQSSFSTFCCCRQRRHINKNQFIQRCSYCVRCRNSIQHQIDKQLTSMIISEIFVTVFTSVPYGSYAFYHLLYGIEMSIKNDWISLFIRISMYFEASCGFYIYLITLKTLRKRFCKIFLQKITSRRFCS